MDRKTILAVYNEVIEKVRKDSSLNEIKTRHIELVVEAYEKLKDKPSE